MKIYINNKPINLDAKSSKGEGGEAEVFLLQNGDLAKIYKTFSHPSYAFEDNEQENAKTRLKIAQTKIPALTKLNLPAGAVGPKDIIYNAKKQIIGYTMDFINNADMLSKYFKDRKFRQSFDNNQMLNIFKNIHTVVNNIHVAKVILGDFNDMNVMIDTQKGCHIIDIDSAQFDNFLCNMFTDIFVDPTLCDINPTNNGLTLAKPYNENSDWYSFAVMLLRNLLLIHSPFAGVYNPSNKPKIKEYLRPLHRITIFDPEVKYPTSSVHYQVLSDDLLEYFEKTFAKDKREQFPIKLLENTRWTSCSNCGTEHAREKCPNCAFAAPALKKTIRGKVTLSNIFRTPGQIVFSRVQKGEIQWIYHESSKFLRNSQTVIPGNLDPHLKFKTCGNKNIFGKLNKMVVLEPNKPTKQISISHLNNEPLFDVNDYHYFWIDSGSLFRDDMLDSHKYIGNVLEDQTYFWVENDIGFGFYRASSLFQGFIIDTINGGINDNVKLPALRGNLIDHNCFISKTHIWFFTNTKEGSKNINRCFILDNTGDVLTSCEGVSGEDSWIGDIYSKFAIGDCLLSITNDGIVKVNTQGQVEKDYPDTQGLVQVGNEIYPSKDGIYVVDKHNVALLQMK